MTKAGIEFSEPAELCSAERFSGKWEVKKIGEFASCAAGGTPSTLVPAYWDGAIRWMTSGELNLKVVTNVEGRITERGLRESSARLLPPESVLIGLAGQGKTRGTVAISRVELCTNQSIAAIYPNEQFVPEFLYHCLDAEYEKLRELSSGGGGRGGLTLEIIMSVSVPFPQIDEQRAIAAALSDVDGLLDSLDALIAKKQAVKQATMQQLLTGRTRLPGFGGEWGKKRLGEFAPLTYGAPLPADERAPNGSVPVFGSNGIVDHHNLALTAGPSIIVGRKGSFGKVHYSPGPCWPIDTTFYVNGYDAELLKYKYYLLSMLDLDDTNTDSAVPGLNRSVAHSRDLLVPPKPEQRAISIVISDMDAEIEALERRRDKTQAIREGMMQELLTGRVRLVEAS